MRPRRLACFLLGLWIAGGLWMQWISRENHRLADGILDHPDPAASLQFRKIGSASARLLLHYQASEQNRFYFECWEIAQILLGFVFFCFLLFGTREDKLSLLLALVLLLATVVQRFLLTPDITAMSRLLDFVPPDVSVEGNPKLRILETTYTVMELGKLAIGLTLTVLTARGGRRRSGSDVRKELDLINKANYRHIDR